jgi:hypothetical protein
MTRMIRGSVLLAACVGLWSCASDPTADGAGVATKITALPSVVFIKQDSSQLIAFAAQDKYGAEVPAQWTLTGTSPLFTVALDSSFRPVYNTDGTLTLPDSQTEVRATITGTALGVTGFTAKAAGLSADVTVNVVPGTLHATFSPANPAPGEVVTMTMPPTLLLTDSSTISFPVSQKDTANHSVVSLVIAGDHKSATFIPAPTVDTTATVTNVVNLDVPTLKPVTVNTETKVTGTQAGTVNGFLPAVITPASSAASPNATGSITVTLNPAYAFATVAPTSAFSFAGQTAPILTGFSADSTAATLDVGPNVQQALKATSVTFKNAPQFVYDLISADSVFTPTISSFDATLSNYMPDLVEPIVLTAAAGYSFSSTAIPTWGSAGEGRVLSRTATTLTVQPQPGSAGAPTVVSGVISNLYPAFQIKVPAILPSPLAMQSGIAPSPFTGTDAYATAPLIGPNGIMDAGTWGGTADCGIYCQIYTITVTAGQKVNFTLGWDNNDDLGLYFLDSTFAVLPGVKGSYTGIYACDYYGKGGAEACTVTFPDAGTYYLEVDSYGPVYSAPVPSASWINMGIN